MTRPVDKDKARSVLRRLAAEERERIALELYVKGKTFREIGMAVDRAEETARRIVHRGLARRAQEEGPTVEAARVLYTARLEHLIGAWMPLADGSWMADNRDPDDPPARPDARAADITIKLMEKWAEVTGALAPRPAPEDEQSGTTLPESVDKARQQILLALVSIRDKQTVVEQAMSSVGATIEGTIVEDTPGPPPIAA